MKKEEDWHVGMRNGSNIDKIYCYDGEDQYNDTVICSVYGIPMNAFRDEIPSLMDCYEQGVKNAQLIASIPRLIEALENCYEELNMPDYQGERSVLECVKNLLNEIDNS